MMVQRVSQSLDGSGLKSSLKLTLSRHKSITRLNKVLVVSILALFYLLGKSSKSLAQVTSDGTVNTQVNQDGNSAVITGGETRGGNLFHSFQDFSVQTGNEAFFDNANDISNIFSRVTGDNISNIDGGIRANGSASLFLINPAGIIFGENARLDIGGSFYGSTASSILFEDGEFSAVDNLAQPILTVNAPVGLGFRDNPEEIKNRSRVDNLGLEVLPGKDIALLGGNINLEGGLITAPEGRITLGGLNTSGEISITEANTFSFPEEVNKSNVSLSQRAGVNVRGAIGGSIDVDANNLNLAGNSQFLAGIAPDVGSPNVQSGDINLNLNNLFASGESEIRNETLGIGNAGNIDITTGNLELTEGAAIVASTFGQGNGGDVNINATGDVSIDRDFGGIYSTVGIRQDEREPNVPNVVGNAGDITIEANSLSLTNGARLVTKTAGEGNAGNVNINTRDQVLLDGKGTIDIEGNDSTFNIATAILTQVELENEEGTTFAGQGNAGNIEINTANLIVTSTEEQDFGPQIFTENRGGVGNSGNITINASGLVSLEGTSAINSQLSPEAIGNAGNITINASGLVSLEGTSEINSQLTSEAIGNAGNIDITANSFEVSGASEILSNNNGQGNAGNITIDVSEVISIEGNGRKIQTGLGENTKGIAGNIDIRSNALIIENEAQIIASTDGQGNAGNITITTDGAIDLISLSDGAQIASEVQDDAIGNGGNIFLDTGELHLTDNSEIRTDTTGMGNAGNIEIKVMGGDINLSNSSQIQSQTRDGGVGDSGDISIETDGSLFSRDGNLILVDSQAQGDGGNITIFAEGQIILEGRSDDGFPSQIFVGLSREDSEGTGGEIIIEASKLVLDDVAIITSNTVTNSEGDPGNILIDVDDLSLSENSVINALTANDQNGGEITINAQTLDLASGGKILAATDGAGNAGSINLNVSDRITIDNSIESSAPFFFLDSNSQLFSNLQSSPSGIYADTTENSTGNGGNVNIGIMPGQETLQEFVISNEGQIVVDSQGEGKGGSIDIISQNLELDNGSISASTQARQDNSTESQSAFVKLTITDNLILNNGSEISAEAFNDADGGNINIDTDFIIAFPNSNSDIIANADKGEGGNISISAESLFGVQERFEEKSSTNDITASSDTGISGNITITTPDVKPVQGTVELPNNIVVPEETSQQACEANRESAAQNGLNITGKGGITPDPGDPLNSLNTYVGGESTSAQAIPAPIETAQGKIQLARGIEVTKSGEIILTAYRTNNSGDRLPEVKRNCNSV